MDQGLPPAPPAPPAAAPSAAPVSAAQVPPTHLPLVTFAIVLAVIGVLYFGREIFVPFALALLLSFVLAPITIRLRRWGLGRVPSVIAVVALAFVLIGGIAATIAWQLYDLADRLPQYQRNLHEKIVSLRGAAPDGGLIERATTVLRDLSEQLSGPAASLPAGGDGAGAPGLPPQQVRPVPVEIYQPETSPLAVIEQVAGPLIAPVGTAGIVLVFVIFILLEREDLRDRLIRLLGPQDLHRTTEALTEAARRVARYLLMQLVVNSLYGIPVGIGLYFIGVPNPALWGLLTILLRFIPYLGTFLSAGFPILLSLAVSPGWTMPLETAALFLVIEVIITNLVEPWLYGTTTGISSLAIILAAIFWTWLWGPVGLLLSTPLTTCLVVLGRYVPRLQFLDVMLGNEPVLAVEEKFYQRMLAGDPEEAIELAEEFLKDQPLVALYDSVIVPALRLAEQDRQRGVLDNGKQRLVADGMLNVIDYFSDHEEGPAVRTGAEEGEPAAVPLPAGFLVLSLAGRSSLDEVAATMLAQLVMQRGGTARVLPPAALGPADLPRIAREGAPVICVSFLHPAAMLHARHLCRRLRRHAGPATRLMAGLWNGQVEATRRQEPLAAIGADMIVASLASAIEQIERLAGATAAATTAAPAETAAASPAAAPPLEARLGTAG